MPKITAQAVPPELQALYTAITSPGKVTQGADGTLRLKKGKKAPKRRAKENLDLLAFQYIAEQVVIAMGDDPTITAGKNLIYEITQELAVGLVNPAYFTKCKRVSAVTLESIPTSVEDPNPPPYGYRTTANYPTRPTYPDGTITTEPPGYAGAKVLNLFTDTYLRWRKLAFTSPAIEEVGGEKKILMRWNVRIDIDAGSRGSRPMLSLHIKGAICGETGSDMDSTAPPLLKKTSLYWRFKVPPSTPPYYHSYQVRNIVKPFARFAKKSGGGLFTHYLLNASNRPMEGRGFNNNDNVVTSFDNDPELWEIAKCFPKHITGWQAIPWSTVRSPRDICYSPELDLYVAACDGYSMTSKTLSSWNTWWTGYNTIFWSIIWANTLGLFVMVGESSSAFRIMTSPDGKTWTLRFPPGAGAYRVVAWSEPLGIIVALNYYGGASRAHWSNDGITWYQGTGTEPFLPGGCIWVDELGLFVATGDGMGIYGSMTSPDGKAWTMHNKGGYGGYKGVAWSPTLACLVTVVDWWPSGVSAYSTDGANWTETPIGYANSFNSVAWCPPLNAFIASGGASGAENMLISSDGVSWAPMPTGNTQNWYAVRWIPDKCLAVTVGPNFDGLKFMKTTGAPL